MHRSSLETSHCLVASLPSSSLAPGLSVTSFLTPPAQVLYLLPENAGADLQVSNLVLL